MSPEELQAIKQNTEWMSQLQAREEEALQTGNLTALYEVLDAALLLEWSDERINTLYGAILGGAFDLLAQKLNDAEPLIFEEASETAALRAIYEHGIERYSNRDFKGAKEIFLVLHFVSDHPLVRDAMLPHIAAAAAKLDLDAFIERYAQTEMTHEDERLGYFLVAFKPEIETFMQANRQLLERTLEELETLKDNA